MIVVLVLGIFMICSVMTSAGRSNREMELAESLPSAVEEAVIKLTERHSYPIASEKELIADMIETLCQTLDNDCDLIVDIANADLEKGLLGVKATAVYQHPNGKKAQTTCERVVVAEKVEYEPPKQYRINFYVDGKIYKRYSLMEEDKIIQPKSPSKDGKTFLGWTDKTGKAVDFSQPVYAEQSFYAKWDS